MVAKFPYCKNIHHAEYGQHNSCGLHRVYDKGQDGNGNCAYSRAKPAFGHTVHEYYRYSEYVKRRICYDVQLLSLHKKLYEGEDPERVLVVK